MAKRDEAPTSVSREPLVSPVEARDELNLAEFPLCCIADRTDPGRKTLSFEDRVWDASRCELVIRQLLITGADEYGLPTALDDEVLLGLIQLSRTQDFAERKVHFTRYQLIRLLNWRDESKSYQRIEKSFNRWVGVTLYYQNAWWDKGDQCWADEKFHVLDNVTLFDREKARRRRRNEGQAQLPLSSFVWNEVLFRSFKAGNLKSLDFDFFKRLESSVAKRLYRFLDKRFFYRPRAEFDLKKLAWEHVGLSRKYDTANLKRKLKRGITELEREGFLVPQSDAERFRKLSCGEWRVSFEKARSAKLIPEKTSNRARETQTLEYALVERGVILSVAQRLALTYAPYCIRAQIEAFDWLQGRNDRRVSENPAGFLVSAIKSAYVPPPGFVSERRRQARATKPGDAGRRLPPREHADRKQENQRLAAEAKAIQNFWNSCPDEERRQLEAEALANASSFERELASGEGTLAHTARHGIFNRFALKVLARK